MSSIKEVAAEAQVSSSTVSKVLNRRHDGAIPAATRERVLEVAQRIGYHPSAIARGLAGKRMDNIGVVMAYSELSVTSDAYLGPCLDGILAQAKKHRQKTTLFLEDDWSDALVNAPMYADGHADGLLIIIPRIETALMAALRQRATKLPLVLVGDSRDASLWPEGGCADVDNTAGAQKVVEHLIELGHRRIAAFCGNEDFCSNSQRLQGYRNALEKAGIPLDPVLLFSGEYHAEWGASNVGRMLGRFDGAPLSQQPTAIFCLCDAIAVGAMAELSRRRIAVPERISVVGFDDIPAAESLGLTTIHHDIRRVGEHAVNALLSLITGTSRETRLLLDAPLVLRQSTAAL
ncbi:MAG: LacI family DNA-binding transcriptional regulator [Armatimonas sp.]